MFSRMYDLGCQIRSHSLLNFLESMPCPKTICQKSDKHFVILWKRLYKIEKDY